MLTCTSTFKMENCKICNVAGFFCQVVSSILSILTNQDLLRIDFFSNIIVWNSKLAVSLSFSMIYSPVVILTIMHITSMSVLKLERLLLLDFFLWDCFYLSKKNVNVLINQTSFFFFLQPVLKTINLTLRVLLTAAWKFLEWKKRCRDVHWVWENPLSDWSIITCILKC